MYVNVNGSRSSEVLVRSGVPQGSVLGPILFLIYVNYLPSHIKNMCKIFADDLKLYLKIRSVSVASLAIGVSSCQRDIDVIRCVAASWGLHFNITKCKGMRFHRRNIDWKPLGALDRYYLGGKEIEMVSSHKDLGILIDSSLRFHLHIRSIAAKASGLVSNFLKSTLSRSKNFMISILKSHIRPLLEFASPVWFTGYNEDIRILESVQRRWTREIDGLKDLSYAERLECLDLFSVKGRLVRADLILCWKIFQGQSTISPEMLFSLDTRPGNRGHRIKIFHPFAYTEARKRFFSIRCITMWNSLPDSVVASTSLTSFKSGLLRTRKAVFFEYD